MLYEVLINYTKPDEKNNSWYAYNYISTYSQVISKFKKEINSVYYSVFVRKYYQDLNGHSFTTNFKLITKISYPFSHFPRIPDLDNFCLIKKFNEVINNVNT